jgi:hypothetical protein
MSGEKTFHPPRPARSNEFVNPLAGRESAATTVFTSAAAAANEGGSGSSLAAQVEAVSLSSSSTTVKDAISIKLDVGCSSAASSVGRREAEVAEDKETNRRSVGYKAEDLAAKLQAAERLKELKEELGNSVSWNENTYLIREGYLTKNSGDAKDKYLFLLTNEDFVYCKRKTLMFQYRGLEYHLSIPLTKMFVEVG